MTEAEWLTCTDLPDMLAFLSERASDRKLLLFAVACCRRIWPFLHADHGRRVVELVERAVDGQAVGDELRAAASAARSYVDSDEGRLTEVGCSAAYAAASITEDYPGERKAWIASRTADCVGNTRYWIAYEAEAARGSPDERAGLAGKAGESAEEAAHIALLHDIFGNPFRPATLDSSWLTPSVVSLARTIYDERTFHRMPELADALEQAGCAEVEVLGHCRGAGSHVKGCWVVDLVLDKT